MSLYNRQLEVETTDYGRIFFHTESRPYWFLMHLLMGELELGDPGNTYVVLVDETRDAINLMYNTIDVISEHFSGRLTPLKDGFITEPDISFAEIDARIRFRSRNMVHSVNLNTASEVFIALESDPQNQFASYVFFAS